MLEFILQYWLQFLLGIISTGLSIACKKIYSLYKKEKNHQKTKEQKEFYDGIKDCIKEEVQKSRANEEQLQQQIDSLKKGVLSLQGRIFKQECRDLLEQGREFTVDEFESLKDEHSIYNGLGGNSGGDALFELVKQKAAHILTDNK